MQLDNIVEWTNWLTRVALAITDALKCSEKLPRKLRKISKIGNEIQKRGRKNIEGPHE